MKEAKKDRPWGYMNVENSVTQATKKGAGEQWWVKQSKLSGRVRLTLQKMYPANNELPNVGGDFNQLDDIEGQQSGGGMVSDQTVL